jgi:hypothetical protein
LVTVVLSAIKKLAEANAAASFFIDVPLKRQGRSSPD